LIEEQIREEDLDQDLDDFGMGSSELFHAEQNLKHNHTNK